MWTFPILYLFLTSLILVVILCVSNIKLFLTMLVCNLDLFSEVLILLELESIFFSYFEVRVLCTVDLEEKEEYKKEPIFFFLQMTLYIKSIKNWCKKCTLTLILIKTNVENVLCASILNRIDENKSVIFFWVNAFYISCFKNWCKI